MSFIINCDEQAKTDRLWENLSERDEGGGLCAQAMLRMAKISIADLKCACEG
ncbi:MAG: hypothetical protein ABWZ80_07570 [Beijerinckiaceae bacterium]